jgi:hypothetical protein
VSESFSLEALFLTAEEYGITVYAKVNSLMYVSFADITFGEENKTTEVLNRILDILGSYIDGDKSYQAIQMLINKNCIRFEYGLFSEVSPGTPYYYKKYIDPGKIYCFNYLQSLAVQLFLDSV